MARVNIEEVIDHLDTDIRNALYETVTEAFPGATVDRYSLFRLFKRHVRRKCNTWEQVPDQYVDRD